MFYCKCVKIITGQWKGKYQYSEEDCCQINQNFGNGSHQLQINQNLRKRRLFWIYKTHKLSLQIGYVAITNSITIHEGVTMVTYKQNTSMASEPIYSF